METKHQDGLTSEFSGKSLALEVQAKPKRRRFSTDEKLRILHETDTCTPGSIGAVLRREGIYSSHLAAWRQARERSDLDPVTLRLRSRQRGEHEAARRRIVELERENRGLQRKLQRAELILDIQKKAAGLLGIELNSPETDGIS